MLKIRVKRLARQNNRMRKRLADVQTSITQLDDDDLLDFADIFEASSDTTLKYMAAAEMLKRNIRL